MYDTDNHPGVPPVPPNTPTHDTHKNTPAIPQTQDSTETTVMPFLNFETGPNYYGYEHGVNAANLTLNDINNANGRLAPMRQQRIREGLIKATRDDPGYVSLTPVATKGFCDYVQWTKVEMLKAMIARGLASKRTRLGDMTKDKMVTRLEKADKNSRFPRFMELAPELREMVYLYAMDSKPRTRPAPPPISRANQLIRRESLPIFFRNTTMNIHAFYGAQAFPPHGSIVIFKGEVESMYISRDYLTYFNYATEAGWFKHMHRFQWYVSRQMRPQRRSRTDYFVVKLSKDVEKTQITVEYTKTGHRKSYHKSTDKITTVEQGTVTDHKFESMSQWFMRLYDRLETN